MLLCTQAYEEEVRSKGTGVNRSLHRLFDTLAGRGTTAYTGKTFICFWANVGTAIIVQIMQKFVV